VIRKVNGKTPRIGESSWVSEAAYVVGDVEIGENCGVWPGAVIRGDLASIKIGNYVTIQDNCVIHSGSPTAPPGDAVIGDRVHIGHGAVVNCVRIGTHVLIGMNATVLNEAEIGDFCIISAGSLVSRGMVIPDRSFVAGVPAEILGEPKQEQFIWTERQTYAELARQYKEQGL
jgi:carbonic anhydrase/acetyltransferase-like protein (isoleucine patch superfamily)